MRRTSDNVVLRALKHDVVRLELEKARIRLAYYALGLLGTFLLLGIGSITWVTLAGRSALELAICVESVATPLFGLVMLILGYFFGNSRGKAASQDPARLQKPRPQHISR